MLAIDRTCEWCGCTFHSSVSDPPTSKRYPRFCGMDCVGKRNGELLRTKWPAARVYFAACADCGRAERLDGPLRLKEWRCERHREWPATRIVVACAECGAAFVRPSHRAGRSVFCSAAHRQRAIRRNAKHRRRGRQRGGEVIYRRKIYDRDGGRCHLCRKRIDWSLKSPHPLSFTLDHVVPLAKGGRHEYANLASAHRQCNCEKSDGLMASGEQLMLIG